MVIHYAWCTDVGRDISELCQLPWCSCSINPAGMGTGLAMSTWSRHGATHLIPCESRSTRVCAVPGCMDSHGITWRTTACAWGPCVSQVCTGHTHGPLATWHIACWQVLSMTTRAHAGMIKHEKGMYGSCGSMEAWSDMGPAVCGSM